MLDSRWHWVWILAGLIFLVVAFNALPSLVGLVL